AIDADDCDAHGQGHLLPRGEDLGWILSQSLLARLLIAPLDRGAQLVTEKHRRLPLQADPANSADQRGSSSASRPCDLSRDDAPSTHGPLQTIYGSRQAWCETPSPSLACRHRCARLASSW